MHSQISVLMLNAPLPLSMNMPTKTIQIDNGNLIGT